jgi:hypothetical protein
VVTQDHYQQNLSLESLLEPQEQAKHRGPLSPNLLAAFPQVE